MSTCLSFMSWRTSARRAVVRLGAMAVKWRGSSDRRGTAEKDGTGDDGGVEMRFRELQQPIAHTIRKINRQARRFSQLEWRQQHSIMWHLELLIGHLQLPWTAIIHLIKTFSLDCNGLIDRQSQCRCYMHIFCASTSLPLRGLHNFSSR